MRESLMIEQTQKSFDELNEEHIKILEEQTKQIEEKRDILSKLTGLVEGYETRKAKLVEEMRETLQERKTLQSDIKALLAEQKKINENLAERVHGL